MLWNIAVFAAYILMLVGISWYTRRKNATTEDFLLAGRGLGGWMSAFAYGTTYFSAVIFIGYAGKFGWNFGISAVWVGIGNAVIGSLLAWLILARRTRNATRFLNVKTMPEYFEKRFDGKHIKLFSAVIIFVFLLPYSASVYQGLSYLFEHMFKIDFIWCVVIIAALTGVYVFFGGLLGTTLSNFIQGIIMLAGVLLMMIFFLNRPEVNWFDGLKALSEKRLGLLPQGGDGTLLGSNAFNLVIIVLLTSFGVWGLPQTVSKYYAVKNESAIRKGIVISTVFALIIGVCAYLIGALGQQFFTSDTVPMADGKVNFDMIVPTMLMSFLPAWLLGLVMVLLLAASMSTLSSLAMTGASAVSVDIYKGCIKKDAPDKKVNRQMKIVCLIFIVTSALLAVLQIDAIVAMMGLSWGTLAGCFLGPYVFSLYSKKVTRAALWTSMIGGLVITVTLVIWLGIGRSPLIGVIAMAFSVISTPLVSLIGRKNAVSPATQTLFEGINAPVDGEVKEGK